MSRDGFVENTMGSIRMWASTQQQQQQTQTSSPNATTESINEDSASSFRGGGRGVGDAKRAISPPPATSTSTPVLDSSATSTIGKTAKRGRSGSITSSLREKIAAHGSTPALVSSQVASVASASASSVMLNTPNGSSGDPRPSIGRFGSSSASLGSSSFVLTKSWVSEMESLLKVRSPLYLFLSLFASLLSCRARGDVFFLSSHPYLIVRIDRTCTPPSKLIESSNPSEKSSLLLISKSLTPTPTPTPSTPVPDRSREE